MRKLFTILVTVLLIFIMFPQKVSADMGPKPSVNIDLSAIDEEWYATLLSKEDGVGPWTKYVEGQEPMGYSNVGEDIFMKFADYAKDDDYYFLQYIVHSDEDREFTWTYYPPDDFKLLIYLADSDKFIETKTYSKYAFDSYYRYDPDSNTLIKNYNYTGEIISFFVRVIATIIIEVIIAYIFGFKDHLKLIIITNIITQSLLNLYVNMVNHYAGLLAVMFTILIPEIIILVLEAIIYKVKIKKNLAILYAVVANAVSFLAGVWLASVIPGLF